jgi:hypothetical protein
LKRPASLVVPNFPVPFFVELLGVFLIFCVVKAARFSVAGKQVKIAVSPPISCREPSQILSEEIEVLFSKRRSSAQDRKCECLYGHDIMNCQFCLQHHQQTFRRIISLLERPQRMREFIGSRLSTLYESYQLQLRREAAPKPQGRAETSLAAFTS